LKKPTIKNTAKIGIRLFRRTNSKGGEPDTKKNLLIFKMKIGTAPRVANLKTHGQTNGVLE